VLEYRYGEGKREQYSDLLMSWSAGNPKSLLYRVPGSRCCETGYRHDSNRCSRCRELVGTGVVASLARPGGNVTGLTSMASDLSGKRLELLKEVAPNASRVAVFWRTFPGSQDEDEVKQTQVTASWNQDSTCSGPRYR
jgi:putative tryptophan/tyrosine transport system substrate-binding protein